MPGSDFGASSRGEKLRSSTRPAQRRPANCLAQMVPSNYWQGDSHEATRNIVLCGTRRELQRSARQENPRERDPARGTCARGKDACGTVSWLVGLACAKATQFGYPHELWTTRLLAAHGRNLAIPPASLAVPATLHA